MLACVRACVRACVCVCKRIIAPCKLRNYIICTFSFFMCLQQLFFVFKKKESKKEMFITLPSDTVYV